jgi:uncharacterized protein (DUF1684 family)
LHVPNKQKKKCQPDFSGIVYCLLANQTYKYRVLLFENGVPLCITSTTSEQRDSVETWIHQYDTNATLEWVPDFDLVATVASKSTLCTFNSEKQYSVNSDITIQFEAMSV